MTKKKICSTIVSAALFICTAANVCAAGVSYMPYVTKDMSQTQYWTNDENVLMTVDEILNLNKLTLAEKGTNMNDLKNQAEIVDGIALNEALLSSAKADVNYYLGWTYIDDITVATEDDFTEFIQNTQNKSPKKEQAVKYGIAVKATELRAFPSPKAIGDDPYDKDFDYQYLSSLRVNEPIVILSVSADGKYYLAKNICCSGWVPVENVAVCDSKSQWLDAWDIAADDALVVYGDKVYTEYSNTAASTSGLMLTMGTVLKTEAVADANELIDNRAAYQNYVVWLPVRNDDGSYDKKLSLISESEKVSLGYLPMTEKNICDVAFSALGNTYGWGGSLYSSDCSGYARNIYKCFGLELARNTTWQAAMPMAKVDMKNMCREERIMFMDALPFGSLLYFNGHEMMYLGKDNGKYYVVSAISSVMLPDSPTVRRRIRSTVINTLDIMRGNGNSWLDDLTDAVIPYRTQANGDLPNCMWYHDGVAYCLEQKLMQGDQNKMFNPESNITLAELLQILWNKEGKPQEEDATENWYDNAVKWANSAVFANGGMDAEPVSILNREQIAFVLHKYAEYKEYDVTDGGMRLREFTDYDSISEYALNALTWAVNSGLMTGKSADKLCPGDNTTRAEIAVMLMRFDDITSSAHAENK